MATAILLQCKCCDSGDCCASDCPHYLSFTGTFDSWVTADGDPTTDNTEAVPITEGDEGTGPFVVQTFTVRGQMSGFAFSDCAANTAQPTGRVGLYEGYSQYYSTSLGKWVPPMYGDDGFTEPQVATTFSLEYTDFNGNFPLGWYGLGFTADECLDGATMSGDTDTGLAQTYSFTARDCDPLNPSRLGTINPDFCDESCSPCKTCPDGPTEFDVNVTVNGNPYTLTCTKVTSGENVGANCGYSITGTIEGDTITGSIGYVTHTDPAFVGYEMSLADVSTSPHQVVLTAQSNCDDASLTALLNTYTVTDVGPVWGATHSVDSSIDIA